MENNQKPPYSNTGATCTQENSLIASVDWVSITFKDVLNWAELCKVLNIPKHEFILKDSGSNGYKKMAVCDNIIIFYEPGENTKNMGCHVNMSGQGCREYESRFGESFNWSVFFALCMNFNINFSRLDIAIDDLKGYFTLKQVMNSIKEGQVVSKFKLARNLEEHVLKTGETKGQTIYFGNSDIMFRFYDKKQERLNKGFQLKKDVQFWQRYEIQLRSDHADKACRYLAYDSVKIGEFAKGLYANYLDFKIKSKTDSNRRRWKTTRWWKSFLGNCKKISLSQVAPDYSIERSKHWIDNQVAATMAMIYEAYDYDPRIFTYFIALGKDKMNAKQIKLAKDFKSDENYKNISLNMMYKKVADKEIVKNMPTFGDGKNILNINEYKKTPNRLESDALSPYDFVD